tara:strand:- start:32 stop:352 length:321 start_codon:yes stop_codon:yes gene_type:complete
MFKNFLLIFLLIFLSHCATPGSALLGPTFTGASTKSLARTSLSFGTNQIIHNIKETSKKGKKEVIKIVKRFDDFTKGVDNNDFYTSVKSLYLQDKQQKRKKILFHR